MKGIFILERISYMLAGAGLGIFIYSQFNYPRQCSSNISDIIKQPLKSEADFPSPNFTKFGYPGPVSDFRPWKGYISSYNRMLRNPNFSLEVLSKESLIKRDNSSRKHSEFRVDSGIPELFQAKLADYRHSGYDRGHMVPSADLKATQETMDETFYLSNMAPQVGQGFNRDYWAFFESFCRKLTFRFSEVYVITGPLYLPSKGPQFPNATRWYVQYEVIGNPPSIAVPTHFYKIILATSKRSLIPVGLGAFLLPNTVIPNSTPLTRFQVPSKVVERAAGLLFFDKLGPNKDKLIPNLCTVTLCHL